MSIVTFANQKGGVGKSTITQLVANSLSQDYGMSVLVVDADLQATLSNLRAMQQHEKPTEKFSFDLEQVPLGKLFDFVRKVHSKYDVIIVDIPGVLYSPDGSAGEIMKLMYICDVVLMPIRASVFDYDSSRLFYKHLQEVVRNKKATKADMEVYGFINQHSKTSENAEMQKALQEQGFAMLKSKISLRVDYQRLAGSTRSLQKSSVSNPGTKREFGEFTDEIVQIIKSFQ